MGEESTRIGADDHDRIREFPGFVVAQGTADDGTEIEPPRVGDEVAAAEDCVWMAAPQSLHAPSDPATTMDNWTDLPLDGCDLEPVGEHLLAARVACRARLSNQGVRFTGSATLSYLIMAPRPGA